MEIVSGGGKGLLASMDIAINGRFLSQPTTGVQRVAKEFTKSLDKLLQAQVTSLTNVRLLVQSDANLSELNLGAIEPVVIKGGRGHLWEQFSMPHHIGKYRLLCLGNTAPLNLLLRRKPVAVMLHDLSYQIFPSAYKLSYRVGHSILTPLILRHANPIITVSHSERELLVNRRPEAIDRITVAQNGGWEDCGVALEHQWRFGSEDRYGLYVGSLSSRKNIEAVIRAAIKYTRATGRRFKIVGGKGLIISDVSFEIPNDVSHLIQLMGQIEDRKILGKLYERASFLLFPSFYEASPLPPIEAMAFGCPVIASDIPSLRERCDDAAYYCAPNDDDAIFSALMQMDQNPTLANSFSNRGLKRSSTFTWQQQAKLVVAAMEAA